MSIFKAYDIRGRVPAELNTDMARAIGQAAVDLFKPETVAVGRDGRESSPMIFEALTAGLLASGVDVVDLGRISTPVFYFACGRGEFPLGIMITASHNPREYNGFKMVRAGAYPIQEEEIQQIRQRVEAGVKTPAAARGSLGPLDPLEDYRNHIHRFAEGLVPVEVVMDAGNAVCGGLIPFVFEGLPLKIIPLYFEVDGTFPNHQPDPLKPENVAAAQEKILKTGAKLGCVFDGDGDRVILLDEKSQVLAGDMATLLIALDHVSAGDKGPFLTDCRSSWIVGETLEAKGAKVIKSRVGHSFIKKTMRQEHSTFGGELSGHYYFKANYFTENSDLAVVRVLRMMARDDKPLSALIAPFKVYSQSGEINSTVADKEGIMARLAEEYGRAGGRVSYIDGVSVEFADWWFNLRPSNTEPLLRLNVEGKSEEIMASQRDELLKKIRGG